MADTLDLITLTEAKRAINVDSSDTTNDTEIGALITRVSRLIDEKCGPVVARAVTEAHDGGTSYVKLTDYPVSDVTTVTEYVGTVSTALDEESAGTQPAAAYLLDDRVIRRRASGSDACFPAGRRNVVVVFSAGRYAATASVDERFKGAASLTFAHYWRAEHGMGTGTFGGGEGATFLLPNAAKELIARDLRDDVLGLLVR